MKLKPFKLIVITILSLVFTPLQSAKALTFNEIVAAQTGQSSQGQVLGASIPELPRVYLDTTLPASSSVCTVNLAVGGDLQAAIDSASLGDTICLQAGATYKYTPHAIWLKNKTSGSGWITIRTNTPDAQFVLPGTRVSPSDAPKMAKVISSGYSAPVFQADTSAHNYRLIGLEIVRAPGDGMSELVVVGDSPNSHVDKWGVDTLLSEEPNNIIFDRVYIHANDDKDIKRGIRLSGSNVAVIDSYISEIHSSFQDAQAIEGWNGPGPYKIVNNYLEATGENILFGGGEPRINNLIPSDIEVRGNYIKKNPAWKWTPNSSGVNWWIKNLFELKNANRVLVDGNIMEYSWGGAQSQKYGVLFQGLPSDSGTWAQVSNLNFTNNIIRHVGGGLAICGHCVYPPAQETNPSASGYVDPNTSFSHDLRFYNNLWDDINDVTYSTDATSGAMRTAALEILSNSANLTIDHNTFISNSTFTTLFAGGASPNITLANNIFSYGNETGMFGDGTGDGTNALNTYLPSGTINKNILYGLNPAGSYPIYPTGIIKVLNSSGVGFSNFNNGNSGNYALLNSSSFKSAGTDGKDIGADIAAIVASTSGVLQGNPLLGSPYVPTPSPTIVPTPTPTPTPSPIINATPTPTPIPTVVFIPTPIPQITPIPTQNSTIQTFSNPPSSPSRLRLVNDNGTFYLVKNNQRQGITNPGMLFSYGFTFSQAKTATDVDRLIPQGSLLLPSSGSLVKSKEDQTVYLVSGGTRHGFTSEVVFKALGYKFSSVLTVTNPELKILPLDIPLSDMSKAHLPGSDININGTIYYIDSDLKLHGYPNLAAYNSWHIPGDTSNIVTANEADKLLPMGTYVEMRVFE